MPNWCMNNLQITASVDEIKEIELQLDQCEGKSFFDIFVPNSEEAGKGDDWYSYNCATYGCKWNCDASDWDVDGEGTTISISFDSPWGPPEELFKTISERYYSVLAYYYEPGMAFCGKFMDGYDECYEIPSSSEEVKDSIPDEIDEFFCISEQMADWEAENEEEDDEDSEKTA